MICDYQLHSAVTAGPSGT